MGGGGLGGAVAYASVDADFRKLLEESVPGSDQVPFVTFLCEILNELKLQVLEALIGAPEPPPPPPKPTVSKLKIPSSVVVTKPKVFIVNKFRCFSYFSKYFALDCLRTYSFAQAFFFFIFLKLHQRALIINHCKKYAFVLI